MFFNFYSDSIRNTTQLTPHTRLSNRGSSDSGSDSKAAIAYRIHSGILISLTFIMIIIMYYALCTIIIYFFSPFNTLSAYIPPYTAHRTLEYHGIIMVVIPILG